MILLIIFLNLFSYQNINGYKIYENNLICSYPEEKFSYKEAISYLATHSIFTSSYRLCSDPNKEECTSLEKINCESVCFIIKYKQASNCNVVISGGTEVGHNKVYKSHTEGFRLNIKVDECNNNFIKKNLRFLGLNSNGSPKFMDHYENTFTLENTNWNILINKC